MEIKRSEIVVLSSIIGKCAIKSVGPDLFLPLIKLKAAATANVEESQKLLKSIYEEYGLTPGNEKLIGETAAKDLMASQKNLNDEVVDFLDTKILNLEKFTLLSDENPTLTASELEFIYKWMVKEN